MPFYRCNLSGGGGGVADCLADLNEQIKGLGEDEVLYKTSASNGWKKKKLTRATALTIELPSGDNRRSILFIDFSKMTGIVYVRKYLSSTGSSMMCCGYLFGKDGNADIAKLSGEDYLDRYFYSWGFYEMAATTIGYAEIYVELR